MCHIVVTMYAAGDVTNGTHLSHEAEAEEEEEDETQRRNTTFLLVDGAERNSPHDAAQQGCRVQNVGCRDWGRNGFTEMSDTPLTGVPHLPTCSLRQSQTCRLDRFPQT